MPDHPSDSLQEIVPLLHARDFAAAIARLQALVRSRGGSRDVFHSLGLALSETGRLREAVLAFDSALKIDETYAPAWVAAGVAHAKLRQPEDARHALLQATRLDPESSHAWLNLSAVLMMLGQNEDAVAAATKAVSLDVHSERALWSLAEAMRLHGLELDEGDRRAALLAASANAYREFVRRYPRSPLVADAEKALAAGADRT